MIHILNKWKERVKELLKYYRKNNSSVSFVQSAFFHEIIRQKESPSIVNSLQIGYYICTWLTIELPHAILSVATSTLSLILKNDVEWL